MRSASSIIVSTPSRFRSISLFQKRSTEASAGEVIVTLRIAPRMRIEIMLTAIDLNYEVVFETDEIYDMAVARGLPAETESTFSP